jgi:hypothetical protein
MVKDKYFHYQNSVNICESNAFCVEIGDILRNRVVQCI